MPLISFCSLCKKYIIPRQPSEAGTEESSRQPPSTLCLVPVPPIHSEPLAYLCVCLCSVCIVSPPMNGPYASILNFPQSHLPVSATDLLLQRCACVPLLSLEISFPLVLGIKLGILHHWPVYAFSLIPTTLDFIM